MSSDDTFIGFSFRQLAAVRFALEEALAEQSLSKQSLGELEADGREALERLRAAEPRGC